MTLLTPALDARHVARSRARPTQHAPRDRQVAPATANRLLEAERQSLMKIGTANGCTRRAGLPLPQDIPEEITEGRR
jgi:hypothetical protein